MIRYKPNDIFKVFWTAGSVFPKAMMVALPCGLVTVALKVLEKRYPTELEPLRAGTQCDPVVLSGFVSIVAFFVVFRTSIAYGRFWDGTTSVMDMGAEWYDACSVLFAFTREHETTWRFKNLLVRLFSALHAVGLAEIEETVSDALNEVRSYRLPVIDAGGLDSTSLTALRESDEKVLLVFQWIERVIVDHMDTVLTVPPPLLTRAFHDLSCGLVAFNKARKVSHVPFPFPYAQTADLVLIFHWLLTPLIVMHWVTSPIYAGVFGFIQVFIMWCLNYIAQQLENPFGVDMNDLDFTEFQIQMNRQLMQLLRAGAARSPTLGPSATLSRPPDPWELYQLEAKTTGVQRSSVSEADKAAESALWLEDGSLYNIWRTGSRGAHNSARRSSKIKGLGTLSTARFSWFAEEEDTEITAEGARRLSAGDPNRSAVSLESIFGSLQEEPMHGGGPHADLEGGFTGAERGSPGLPVEHHGFDGFAYCNAAVLAAVAEEEEEEPCLTGVAPTRRQSHDVERVTNEAASRSLVLNGDSLATVAAAETLAKLSLGMAPDVIGAVVSTVAMPDRSNALSITSLPPIAAEHESLSKLGAGSMHGLHRASLRESASPECRRPMPCSMDLAVALPGNSSNGDGGGSCNYSVPPPPFVSAAGHPQPEWPSASRFWETR